MTNKQINDAAVACIKDYYGSQKGKIPVGFIKSWFNRCVDADYLTQDARRAYLKAVCDRLLEMGMIRNHSANQA